MGVEKRAGNQRVMLGSVDSENPSGEVRQDAPARPSGDEITEAMNRVRAEAGDTKDEFVGEASRRILRQVEW